MIKILHTGDVHLDSPFTLEDPSRSEERKNELRSTFLSMMKYASENAVDIVLISGDLFESEFATKQTIAAVTDAFEALPSCKIVISPGNHDPATPTGVYQNVVFPDNVYVFKKPSLEHFSFDDLGVDIYGYAFTSQTMSVNPFVGKQPENPDKINILCGHGDTSSPISKWCPITERDIASSGFDYVALGHIHNGGTIQTAGDVSYAYCGCPEGRDYGECGVKGAIVGKLYSRQENDVSSFEFVRFSRRRYEWLHLNVTGSADVGDITEKLSRAVKKAGWGEDTQLRVTLEGSVPSSLKIYPRVIEAATTGLWSVSVADSTLPTYDSERLRADGTIRGAFFRELLPILENGSPEEREQAAAALRYGLAALDDGNITDF